MIRVAINGYGRIGRGVARALYENGYRDRIELVALNNLSCIKTSAHLTKYDTTHGIFNYDVEHDEDSITIDGDRIQAYSENNPAALPWQQDNIDLVLECSGKFNNGDAAKGHLQAGASKILISAPATNVDRTIVYGVNHQELQTTDRIVSNASCTTNCLAPIAQLLDENFGITSGFMTTIHAVTNDQILLDARHKDLWRARSAMQSMIPTKTGAAASIGLVLPSLKGKLDGLSVRVPTVNVSLVDLTVNCQQTTTSDTVNQLLQEAACKRYQNIIGYNDIPLVSIDFNHRTESAIFDATQTRVIGNTVKVLAWYDNEWGFSNRMLDVALAMFS